MTTSSKPDAAALLFEQHSRSETYSVMEKLRAQYARTPRDGLLAERFEKLIGAAVQRHDVTRPAGFDNRGVGSGLAIIGPTGVGKSRAIRRFLSRHVVLAGYDDPKSPSPLISVSSPSPCTSMQLARAILRRSGYPIERDLPAHRLWEMVWERLDLIKKFVLHIDELQHVTQHLSEKDMQEVVNLLKHAMEARRISIVISAVDTVLPFLQFDPQLFRRFDFMEFEKISPSTLGDLQRAVHDFAKSAGVTADESLETHRDFYSRLAHAGLGAFGYSIVLTHLAIERCLKSGDDKLTVEHFTGAFALKSAFPLDRNPFKAERWHEIDCSALFVEKQIAPPEPSVKNRRKKR